MKFNKNILTAFTVLLVISLSLFAGDYGHVGGAGGGVAEAPNDGLSYVRNSAGWVKLYIGSDSLYVTKAFFDSNEVRWNDLEQTLDIVTGLGSTVIQVGQELVTKVFNNTGAQIDDGKVINTTGVITNRLPEVELSDNTSLITASAFIGMATQNIADGDSGFATVYGKVRGVDFSGLSNGRVYVGTNGNLTNTRPTFPAYDLIVGGVVNNIADGTAIINPKYDHYHTTANYFNGTIRENFDLLVSSNGTTITATLERSGTGDLTALWSTGFDTLDCTPAQTIGLTAGTDASPQVNYIYVLRSTGALTVATDDWPSAEHARLANVVVKSAATTQTMGALVNRNWNDHIQGTDGMGGHSHTGAWIRNRPAEHYDGAAGTMTVGTNAAALDSLFFSNTSGRVFQKHLQTFSAHDMADGDLIIVVNNNTTAYDTTSNLNTQLTDSEGVSLSTRWYWLVVGGVNNKSGQTDQLFVNLPNASYNNDTASKATLDLSQTAVYSIPAAFKGAGFLIGRYLIHHDTGGNGTFTVEASEDLRGRYPSTTAGGGGTGATEFTGLTDTPASYSGEGGKYVAVNSGETALEFVEAPSGGSGSDTLAIGSLYRNAGTGSTVSNSNATWVKANVFNDVGDVINTAYNSPGLSPSTGYGGLYRVYVSLAGQTGGTGVNSYRVQVGYENSRPTSDVGQTTISIDQSQAMYETGSFETFMDIPADSTVCVWVYNLTDDDDITIYSASLVIERKTYSR